MFGIPISVMDDIDAHNRNGVLSDGTEVLDAVEANVSDDDLRRLVENLVESTLPSVDSHTGSVSGDVHAVIPDIVEDRSALKVRNVNGQLSSVKKMMNEGVVYGKLFVARVDGEVAGMGGVRKIGTLADGRTLYEMGKASVLPQYAGRGVWRKLRDARIRFVAKQYGDVPLVLSTKEKVLKESLMGVGFKKVEPSLDNEMIKILMGDQAAHLLADGQEVFVLDHQRAN